jgi:hypothetical protein
MDRGRPARTLQLGVDDRVGVGGFVAAGSPTERWRSASVEPALYAITCLVASGEFERATTPPTPRE